MKKRVLFILLIILGFAAVYAISETALTNRKPPTFEDAITIIKKYEGISSAKHWPFVGYGHKVMPGEKFTRGKTLSEAEADALVRSDYAKLCAKYRSYGADSLLLAALAYNCGPGVVAKSSVLSKLKAGNRDIEASYLAHCRYQGKQLSQLKRRRQEELATLFVKDISEVAQSMAAGIESETENIEATALDLEPSHEAASVKTDSVAHSQHH